MKEKQQQSKDIRKEIRDLNLLLVELNGINAENIRLKSMEVYLPAITFKDDDTYVGIDSQVAKLIGKCEVCRDAFKDNSKVIVEYNNCINRLEKLLLAIK